MKYTFVLVQGQVNRNFQLVLNEMGPGRASRAWYFHSPDVNLVEPIDMCLKSKMILFCGGFFSVFYFYFQDFISTRNRKKI